MKTIVLGGGCFWCTEAIFKKLRGVEEVVPGYMGGTTKNPSYKDVTTGTTGHAEVIKITYDESIISTDTILDVFFATHDPTTINQQGADHGTQYRSVIFYADSALRDAANAAVIRTQANVSNGKRVVTEVIEQTEFYPAEDYHQEYYAHNRTAPYCQLVIDPKIEKLEKEYSDLL